MSATDCPDCQGTGWEYYHHCVDPSHVQCEDTERHCHACYGSGDATRRGDWCDECGLTANCPRCTPPEPREVA